MARTDTLDQERGRQLAVSLEAELAVVASLVRADHGDRCEQHPHRSDHDCACCQLVAWARSA